MKKYVSLLVFCLAFSSFLSAQVINKNQWTLFTKTSADWCPNCGTWGWNMQKQLVEKFENKNTITWAAHVSGGLQNTAASEIAANLGVNYHPIFFEGQTNMNASSNNVAEKILDAESIVEINALFEPLAGVGVEATINDDRTLEVKANVEFLANVEGGNYFLALYLVEDKLVHKQQNVGPNAVHRYVLRRSLLPTTFGNALITGAVNKGQTFETEVSVENVTGVKENLKVAAIIWNRTTDGKYKFFNANQVDVAITSSSEDISEAFDVKAVFVQNDLNVSFEIPAASEKMNMTLTDVQGKVLWNGLFQQKGIHEKSIHVPAPSGTYILHFDDGMHDVYSRKIIKL